MNQREDALPKQMLITGSDKRSLIYGLTHSHAQVLMDGAAEAT